MIIKIYSFNKTEKHIYYKTVNNAVILINTKVFLVTIIITVKQVNAIHHVPINLRISTILIVIIIDIVQIHLCVQKLLEQMILIDYFIRE